MSLLLEHIKSQMAERAGSIRKTLRSLSEELPEELPKTVQVLEQTNQVKGLHTIIRNTDTTRENFVFYSERLIRLLMENVNASLPYETEEVTTSSGKRFKTGGTAPFPP
jgi:uridine kinase